MYKTTFNLVINGKKSIGSKTCVLMQCGSFFEMYGLRDKDGIISNVTDVEELANVCDILVANKSNKVGGKASSHGGVRNHSN